ncbi:MAG: flippase [Candidatus Magasanikiibacteriota bacterium]
MVNILFNNKIVKETVWSFFTKVITFGLFFLISIFLARKLDVERFGLWSFFSASLSVILFLSYFGINASSMKYVAQYSSTKSIRSVLWSSIKIRFFFSLVFCLFFLICYKQLAYFLGRPELSTLFLLATPLIFFSGLVEFLKNIFMGFHRNKYNFIINFLEYGLKLLLIICWLVFSDNLMSIINSYTLALLITSLVGFYLLYVNFYRGTERSEVKFSKEIINYSLPLFFISIGFWIATEVDVVMLGMLAGDYQVGIYSIAKDIVLKLPHLSIALAMGTMPIFAKMNEENKEEFKKIFYRLIKINTVIFVPITFFIILFSGFFIPFLYGVKYSEAVLPLQLLSPFLLIFSYSAFFGTYLDYRGLAKKRAMNLVLTLVMNIVLNFILIPKLGAVGAAIGTSISYFPYSILNWLEVKRSFKTNISK